MRVFVTGATGYIGMAVVKDLLAAGHQVLGLARDERKAQALAATGAAVHRGSTTDSEDLKAAATDCDGIIHLAFNHDFSRYVQNCEDDRKVIETLGSVLAGSQRPLLITSGAGMASTTPGQPATENDPPLPSAVMPRSASEEAADAWAARGVNVSVVRLSQIHDTRRAGLVSSWIDIARSQGSVAYVGEGRNRWTAAHLSDTAPLYRLALEKAGRGARYNAVTEEGVATRDIAAALGRRLKLPVRSVTKEEAPAYFGWLAPFASLDLPASSAITRRVLGWNPTGPGLIADLEHFEISA